MLHKERERERGSSRKPLLEAVHPNKYPRPNLDAWVPYKPSPEDIRRSQAMISVASGAATPNGTPQPDGVGHAPLPDAVSFFLSQLPPALGFNGKSLP